MQFSLEELSMRVAIRSKSKAKSAVLSAESSKLNNMLAKLQMRQQEVGIYRLHVHVHIHIHIQMRQQEVGLGMGLSLSLSLSLSLPAEALHSP